MTIVFYSLNLTKKHIISLDFFYYSLFTSRFLYIDVLYLLYFEAIRKITTHTFGDIR